MQCTRREVLAMGAGTLVTLAADAEPAKEGPRRSLGMVIHSYGIRRAADKDRGFADPLAFLDYCHTLGAAGVQTSLGARLTPALGWQKIEIQKAELRKAGTFSVLSGIRPNTLNRRRNI